MKFYVPKPAKPNGWRESINLPIIRQTESGWTLGTFERKLDASIRTCFEYALTKNNGIIYTTLSGGLDSSLCLAKIWALQREYPETEIVTVSIGKTANSPDLLFARRVSWKFQTRFHVYIPTPREIGRARKEINKLWPNEVICLGDDAVFLIYQFLSQFKPTVVIAHDGIDELLGGYWVHMHAGNQEVVFIECWERLAQEHLIPLEKKAQHFGIEVVFPYLQEDFVKYISKIPLSERTSGEMSKIPSREIAKKYLPADIINRTKIGFCDALK